jgi:hypothetical protein
MARLSSSFSTPFDVEEVRAMKAIAHKDSAFRVLQYRAGTRSAVLASLLLVRLPTAVPAEPASQSTVYKLALNAYCDEARNKSKPLADGTISYKRIAELASRRALAEHPKVYSDSFAKVYSDSFAWKAKIVALLNQYGDEPLGQLCTENPGAQS